MKQQVKGNSIFFPTNYQAVIALYWIMSIKIGVKEPLLADDGVLSRGWNTVNPAL